jgi:hypothetical protein
MAGGDGPDLTQSSDNLVGAVPMRVSRDPQHDDADGCEGGVVLGVDPPILGAVVVRPVHLDDEGSAVRELEPEIVSAAEDDHLTRRLREPGSSDEAHDIHLRERVRALGGEPEGFAEHGPVAHTSRDRQLDADVLGPREPLLHDGQG